jgi:hypothetical protein
VLSVFTSIKQRVCLNVHPTSCATRYKQASNKRGNNTSMKEKKRQSVVKRSEQ